ncbi:MAG: FAD-binding protein [Armatimonadetes bacterium]|nr:FAD-binding protein [Armatimonadota bacterium]
MKLVPTHVVRQLEETVGKANVIAQPDELIVYECDAYTLERNAPQAVVLPGSTDEVAEAVRICAAHRLPIIPRGAGTSLSGTVLAVDGGIVVATTRMNQVLSIDPRNRRALVEPGCVNIWVTRAAQHHGLHYAPDPSSQMACTIGGNIATNSGGPHTLKYGVTTNHILGFQMVLPDGQIVWLGTEPNGGEDTPGPDLRGAAIGSEGMFGIVTQALLRLTPIPQEYRTMLAVFETVEDASHAVSQIIASGIVPAALEMMDGLIIQAVEERYGFGFPLDARAILIIELDGLRAGLGRQAEQATSFCLGNNAREVRQAQTEKERNELWKCRKRAFGAVGKLSPNFMTHDGVVPRSKLPEMMRFISDVSARYGMQIPNVFHAGDGNLHPLILYNERDPSQIQRAIAAGHEILRKCIQLGGSVTGEHGIGVEKIDFMAEQFTPDDLDAMRALRKVFDPEEHCNPHKMFPGAMRCADFVQRKQIPA